MIKKIIPVLVIFILSYWAIQALFMPGFFPMHDNEQIARLYDLDQTLRAGNIPPRIAPNLGYGYGYPFFNFYPSFAYYVGEVFHLLGFSFIISTKLMLATGFFLSALFMYLFAKEFFGKWGGLIAAVAYTYASYHAVNIYVRGAFAEFFSFVFIPLIFWAIYKLKDSTGWRYVLFGALGVSGLLLSHNLIALMSGFFLAFWIAFVMLLAKKKTSVLLRISILFALGFGLSAYFWLPSYVEKNYTLINILTSELANYNLYFVCIRQLWNSPWGYGGSVPGCFDGLSFEIGKLALILSAMTLVAAIYYFLKKKVLVQIQTILLFGFFLVLTIFFMVKYSKPFWDIFPPFWYIQFPWRFLLFGAFITAFLSGGLVYFIKNEKIKAGVAGIIVFLLIVTNVSHFVPEKYLAVQDQDYIDPRIIRWDTSNLAYEYVPKGIATKQSDIHTTKIDITKAQIATSAAQIISGKMVIDTTLDHPQQKKFTIAVQRPGTLQINTFSFPGWAVFVDNKQVSYTDNNKLKLIQISLTQGKHIVEAKFLDTPIRMTGNILTLLSIIGFIGILMLSIRQKKHEKD